MALFWRILRCSVYFIRVFCKLCVILEVVGGLLSSELLFVFVFVMVFILVLCSCVVVFVFIAVDFIL